MGVSIKLNTNFAFRDTNSEEFSLPKEVKTISDLLRFISQKIGFDLIDPESGELEMDLELTINGKELWFFPTGLDTPLNNGDSVLVSLIPLGGGERKTQPSLSGRDPGFAVSSRAWRLN